MISNRTWFGTSFPLGLLLLLPGCRSSAPPASTQPQAVPVEVEEAREAKGATTLQLSGSLESEREALVSAEVSEVITSWPLKLGDKVEAGQVVAALDDRIVRARLAEAQSQAAQARAEVRRLEAELKRADVETAARIRQAESGVRAAEASRDKLGQLTRSQELRQAEARLAQAKVDEDLARKERDRFSRLVEAGAAAGQTLDQYQARYDVAVQQRVSAEEGVSLAREGARAEDKAAAEAAVGQARASLQSAQSRPSQLAAIQSGIAAASAQAVAAQARVASAQALLSKHVVRAPFSGRVLRTLAEVGEMASPGAPLLELGETKTLKLAFSVPESARVALKGGEARFQIEALPGKSFTALLSSVGFKADPRTRSFAVEGRVSNPDDLLLPGMTARLEIASPQPRKGVEIPLEALMMDGSAASVFVLDQGRARKRRVLVDRRRGGQALVTEGIRPGEKVVVNPKSLADGQAARESDEAAAGGTRP